ncbi:MAG TPA: ATP-binding protein [Planctomycetota bacterium]|nr:ATP-binding protein [Planctomycetota bacterium]
MRSSSGASPEPTVPASTRSARRRRFGSITWLLAALVSALLLPIIAGAVLWSHGSVQMALLASASSRLEGVALQLANLLSGYVQQRRSEVESLASLDAVRTVLCAPRDDDLGPARAAIAEFRSRGPQPAIVELWSNTGNLVLQQVHAPRRTEDAVLRPLREVAPREPLREGCQPIGMRDGVAFYEVVQHVHAPGTDETACGFVVVRRPFHGVSAARMALAGLIGPEVTLMLGNRDGSAWTDLQRVVAGPGVDPLDRDRRTYRDADGTERVGAGVHVEGTPWVLWLDVDLHTALAPARDRLWRMAAFGLLLVLLGVAGAWGICRSITASLREATEAAESIAAGQFERRLEPRGPDEVRRLASAFNVMAERVEDGRQRLEERVKARTADLQDALAKLRDAQDELLRKEKLALLGQLAGGVGHELRNPLGVMSNAVHYLDLVLQDATPEVREYLGILRKQISLSDKIIGDLLDCARVKEPHAEVVSMARLVDEQVHRLGRTDVTVRRDFPADLPPAWVDPVQAGQVVFNLLTNAVQAMEANGGGTVTFRGSLAEDGRVCLEVRDTGPGVPAELRARIFEPLFTTRPRGVGLGLAVSRRLAEANGGELVLLPGGSGDGAAFALLLPAAERVVA